MDQAREHRGPAAPKRLRPAKAEVVARTTTNGQFVLLHAGADVTEIPVSKMRYGRIHNKRAALGKVIANYADIAAKAKRTGKAFVIVHRISPSGDIEIVREAPAEAPTAAALDAALTRAKARGAAKATLILEGADMLSAKAFGELIGASHETVNTKRKRHEVLGLEGATRGVKYPRWQLTDDGLLLPGLTRIFEMLGAPWTVYRFLRTHRAELGGLTALDALKAGQVDAVVGVAANQAADAFS